MKLFSRLFQPEKCKQKGEIASLLTLFSAGLMLLGVLAGSFLAQNQTEFRSKAQTVQGNCDPASNPWVCEIGSWKNCLDNKPGNQSIFNDTYCNGEKMWRFQAAKAHGGTGSECGGTKQALKTTGCGQSSPTPPISIAPTNPPNLTPGPSGNINGYCLGDGGASKVATSFCLQWGQSSPYGGSGKAVGPHSCCDECDPSQEGVWTNTCFRPNSQSSNYQGPCKSDAGVAFPLRCYKDPNDNKWKWISQNHFGECNVVCSTGNSQPNQTPTPTPRTGGVVNSPTPIRATNTPVPPGYPTNTPTPTVISTNTPTPVLNVPSAFVYIIDSSFKPGVLTIKPNITVEWRNYEITGHTVSSNSNVFDSSLIPYNGTFQFTFKSPGTYDYYSKMPPQMKGTIIVEDPNASPTPTLKPGEPTHTPSPTFIPPSVTIIPSPTPKVKTKVCEQLKVNGNQNDNEDIIILGDHYEKIEDLMADGLRVMESMKNTNLTPTRLNKLNFYVYTDLLDFNVQKDGKYDYDLAKSIKNTCNGDTTLLLTKKFDISGGQVDDKGVSWTGVSSLDFNTNNGTVTGGKEAIVVAKDLYSDRHDLAHAIAGAADEFTYVKLAAGSSDQYVKDEISDQDKLRYVASFNCSPRAENQTNSRCVEWKTKYKYEDAGCYAECGYSNWFKPYPSSNENIMMGSKKYNVADKNDHPKYQEFDKPTLELWDIALHLK